VRSASGLSEADLREGVAREFELLAKRWTPQLLVALLAGPARYNELARTVEGVSKPVLTERLRELEEAGVVARQVDAGPPITSTYRLTADGETLRPALQELWDWAEQRWRARSAS
jgi:DNA-binding HxlR family transcriptional regulator